MGETLQLLIEHGYILLFAWVLAEQLGLPLPAVPVLMGTGALAGAGHLNVWTALLIAMVAALISDSMWYGFGRVRGAAVLNLLCRISLEPDSCVRRTERMYERSGARSLLIAKFVPGLNTAAPPVAGMFRMNFGRFLAFDSLGTLLWAGSFILTGYIFSDQLEFVAEQASRLGSGLVAVAVLGLGGYIARKWWGRRRFMRSVAEARITAEEVLQKLEAGESMAIVDLRHPLDILPDPRALPGAIRMTVEELQQRHREIPRDRDIILYCT